MNTIVNKKRGRKAVQILESDVIEFLENSTQSHKDNYSYLLGLYIGCGYIYKCPRTYRFTTYLNKKLTNAIEYTESIYKKFFDTKTYIFDGSVKDNVDRRINIITHSNKIPYLFPQHNTWNEDNNLDVEEWQEKIINHKLFVKGLIMSNGLLFLNDNSGELNIKFLHKSMCVVDIFEKYITLLNFKFNRYIKNGYDVIDIVYIDDSLFIKELEYLKGLSDNTKHLSDCSEKFNERIFEIIDTKEKAYWLGFIYADGNVSTKYLCEWRDTEFQISSYVQSDF